MRKFPLQMVQFLGEGQAGGVVDNWATGFIVMGSYVIAWLAGFVTPGAPAGIGVREAVLVILLATASHQLLSF
jgi:hypothetical protein